MATLLEAQEALQDEDVKKRVVSAILIKAVSISEDAGASTAAKAWAVSVIDKVYPQHEANLALVHILFGAGGRGSNINALRAILNSDAQLQTRVDSYIDNNVLTRL